VNEFRSVEESSFQPISGRKPPMLFFQIGLSELNVMLRHRQIGFNTLTV